MVSVNTSPSLSTNLMQNLESICQGEGISETEMKLSEMIEQLSHLREKLLEKHHCNDEVR